MSKEIIIVGSGNAALCAGIAALEKGAKVNIYEKADKDLAGGNTKYTAGAMRFSYENGSDLINFFTGYFLVHAEPFLFTCSSNLVTTSFLVVPI